MTMQEQFRLIADSDSGPGALTRIASLWGLIGITSWGDFAAFVAGIYSLLLVGEFLWKKAVRPALERLGWMPRRKRRRDDA